MANAGQITSVFNITGRVAPSFNTSLAQANRQLGNLRRSALGVGTGFNSLGRGLLGIAATGLATGGLVSMFQKSAQLAKQEQGYLMTISTLLKNNKLVQAQGVNAYQNQTEAIKEQAKALQETTGISKLYYEQGAAILSTYHATGTAAMELQKSIAQVLVTQRNLGQEGKSYAEVYEAIGKAIETGQPRGLKAIHIEVEPAIQKLMEMNAVWGRFTENMKIMQNVIKNTFGDAAGDLRKTQPLLFKYYTTQAAIMESMGEIGKKTEPMQQKLTVIFGTLAQAFMPYIIRGLSWVDRHLDKITKNLDKIQGAFQGKLREIYKDWMAIFGWMKNNKDWLIPVIKYAVMFRLALAGLGLVLGPVLNLMKLLRDVTGLGLLGGGFVGILITGAVLVATHWTEVKKFFSDWYAALPSDTKTAVDGMAGAWQTAWNTMVGIWKNLPWNKEKAQLADDFDRKHHLGKYKYGLMGWGLTGAGVDARQGANAMMLSGMNTVVHDEAWQHHMVPRTNMFADFINAGRLVASLAQAPTWLTVLKDKTGQLLNAAIGSLTDVIRRQNDILVSARLGESYSTGGVIWSPGRGMGGGSGGNGGLPNHVPYASASGVYNSAAYGPVVKERWHDVMFGPNENALGNNDWAVAPNLRKQFPLGSYVNIYDPTTGRLLYANQRIADWSYKHPGQPNYNMVEQRHVPDLGPVRMVRVPDPTTDGTTKLKGVHGNDWARADAVGMDLLKAAKLALGMKVTLNYHSEHHHHGGHNDDSHEMAVTRRKHANQMLADVEEATTGLRRRSLGTT